MARVPPYRFTATEGIYAGTTFVYPDNDTVISFTTDAPTHYFRSSAYRADDVGMPRLHSSRYAMTDADLARFYSYPEES